MTTMFADCGVQETLITRGTVPPRGPAVLDEIWSLGRVLRLREAVQADLYWEDNHWVCELASIRVMGFGETEAKALEDFCEDFIVTYDGLVDEEDDSLTADARSAKRRLQRLVWPDAPARATCPGLVGMGC